MRMPGLLLSVLVGLGLAAGAALAQPAPRPSTVALGQRFPMLFEPNRGQADARVRYLARGPGQTLLLADREATLVLARPAPAAKPEDRLRRPRPDAVEALALRIAFAGARPQVAISGRAPTRTVINHNVGADRSKWLPGLPTYEEVAYRGLYPGVDLVFRPGEKGLAYDFHVAPGTSPKVIRIAFPTADRLSLDRAGNLVIRIGGEELRQTTPAVYQEVAGRREAVPGGYILRGRAEVGFLIGSYDRTRPLVIDPTLEAGTVFGGGTRESLDFAAFADGPNGDLFVAGSTQSPDLYVVNATQPQLRGTYDGFVARFDAATLELRYATYLGGGGIDGAASVAVAADGRAHVVGWTSSADFPVSPNAAQTARAEMFVARLDPAGQLEYASYLGGTQRSDARAVALSGNRLFVVGETMDRGFATTPLLPGLPPASGRGPTQFHIFIARLDAASGALIDARYLGGSSGDAAVKLAADGAGQIYGVGFTHSSDFPQIGATPQPFGGSTDGLAFKLSAGGDSLVYSTRFGGNSSDNAFAVAVDASGHAHVAGETWSTNFPQVSPIPGQAPPQRQTSGFYVVLDPLGGLVRSTYLGAITQNTDAKAVAIGAEPDTVWVGGRTDGAPATTPAENALSGYSDGYVVNVATGAGGPALRSWTYVGGQGYESVGHIAARPDGSLIVAGTTSSLDFPATLVRRNGVAGSDDVFVARLVPPGDLRVVIDDSKDPVQPNERFSYEITVLNDGTATATGAAVALTLPAGCSPVLPLPGSCTLAGSTVGCAVGTLAGGSHTIPPLGIAASCGQRGSHTATAVVSATTADSNPANNTASETTTVGAADLLVSVQAVDAASRQPLTQPVYANDPVGFRATVRNLGAVPADGVSVASTVSAGCSFVDPAGPGAGGTATFPLTNPLAPAGQPGDRATADITVRCAAGVQRDTVSVSATNEPADLAQADNRDQAEVIVLDPGYPNLLVRTEALSFIRQEPPPLYADDPLRFRATVRNIGPAPAMNVVVTNTAPPLCGPVDNFGTGEPGTTTFALPNPLAPMGSAGDTAAVYVSVRCPAGEHRNSVTVAAANEPAPQAADGNQDHVDVFVRVRPILRVETDVHPDVLRVGGIGRFGVRLSNTGPVTAPNPRLIVTIDVGDRVQLYDRTVFPWATCQPTTTTQPVMRTECTAGDLQPGQTRVMIEFSGFLLAPGRIRLTAAAEAEGARATASVEGHNIVP